MTEPLLVSVGLALGDAPSRADAVVAALARAQADSPRALQPSRRRMLLPLILVTIVIVATSVAVALQMADHDATAPGPGPASHMASGDCLTWPQGEPDRPSAVDCQGDHRFEVADAVAIDSLTDASGTDPAGHLQQIFRDRCPSAVNRYLGSRFDPVGKFGVGMVWSPSGPQPQSGGLLLCGLQLSHPGASSTFQGRVRDLDQSAIWPAGTCLGILDGKATDVPVDCASPHSMEITGAVSLADAFSGPPPAIAAQDGVVRGGCGAVTDAYLSPLPLPATSLTVRYTPIAPDSWAAGSRQIACRLALPDADGRWATLVGSAKTGVLINGGQPAAPAPTPPTADVATAPTAPAASPVEPPQEQELPDAADEPAPEAPSPVEPPDEAAPPPAPDA